MTDYGDLALFIASNIVNDKESVSVRVRQGGRQQVVEIKASAEDMGKLIGRNGRNIDAIRTVVRAAGLRHRQRVQVDVG
jgi:predicted RNA-binding protein YlqC (UPF0109 family)